MPRLAVGVDYARDVVRGRWMAVEDRLMNSSAALLQHADEVVKSRLPDHLHTAMVLNFSDSAQSDYVCRYGM